jgi:site-specific recombinase XerD
VRLYPEGIQKYFDHPSCPVRTESSKTSVRMTVRLFQQMHPDLELHQVRSGDIERFLGAKRADGVSDSTLKKYLQRLRSLFKWSSWQGLSPEDPTAHIEQTFNLRPQPVRTHRWLDEGQVQAILDSINTLTSQGMRDAIILRLAATVGLRNREIRTLPISALENLDNQMMALRGKGGKIAQVWVPSRTAELLARWLDRYESPKPHHPVVIRFRSLKDWTTGERSLVPQWGEGISQQALGRIVSERSAAVGLRVTPHDLRRSYASIVERKVGVVEASKALRHSQIATTQLYLERRQDAAYIAAKSAGIDL